MLKQIFLSICFCFAFFVVSAQDSTQTIRYKNEFGIDATGFLRQFFDFNGTQPAYYTPTYYLTYRRHYPKGNLRAGIGGGMELSPITSPYLNDPNEYSKQVYSANVRFGWEWTQELSKRFQVFYGVDLRPSFYYYKNDAPNWNGGYANGYESRTISAGVAPLLGFRFRINERLSLATEASFAFAFSTSESRQYFTPTSNQFPPMSDVVVPMQYGLSTSFSQPVSLFIMFDI